MTMHKNLLATLAIGGAFAIEAAPAAADLGDARTAALEGRLEAGYRKETRRYPDFPTDSRSTFSFAAMPQFFVADHVSLGIGLLLQRQKVNAQDPVTTVGIEGNVGYDAPLSDRVHLWPRIGLGFTQSRRVDTPFNYDNRAATLVLQAPLEVILTRHLYMSAGPVFTKDLWSRSSDGFESHEGLRNTQLDVMAAIGGWFGD